MKGFSQHLKHHFPTAITAIIVLLFAIGCNSDAAKGDGTEGKNPEKPPKGVEIIDQRSDLDAKVSTLVETAFPDYKLIKMEQVDAFPKFKGARKSIYRHLQRRQPVQTKISPSAYPRVLVKAFEFPTEEDAQKEAAAWLNTHETSADSGTVTMGMNLESIKSPPLLCAIAGSRLFIVQSGCLYHSPEWDTNRQAFMDFMKKENAAFRWRIFCDSRKMEYLEE